MTVLVDARFRGLACACTRFSELLDYGDVLGETLKVVLVQCIRLVAVGAEQGSGLGGDEVLEAVGAEVVAAGGDDAGDVGLGEGGSAAGTLLLLIHWIIL